MHLRSPHTASCQFRRAGWLIVALGTVANGLLACGPFLPEQILIGRHVVLRTPVGEFVREVAALDGPNDAAPTLPPGVERVDHPSQARNWGYHSDGERPANQLEIERKELGEVLAGRNLPEDERKVLLESYKEYRAAVETRDPSSHNGAEDATASFYAQANNARRAAGGVPVASGSPAAPRQTVPALLASVLPAEWADYLLDRRGIRGRAVAHRRGVEPVRAGQLSDRTGRP